MQESPGKAHVRELYYLRLLPAWLTPAGVRAGNHLILLGDVPRELPLLDKLGVPRHRIHSVECDRQVYRLQRQQELGPVSLYPMEMVQFLRLMLLNEQTFVSLNLDIEGSYRKNLDPAMTHVLLFGWRNPRTVVATYSTIGHDPEMLMEGVLSYLLFWTLLPEETDGLVRRLAARYERGRYQEPLRMALRDLFWIRSNLEHSLITTMIVDVIPPQEMERLFTLEALLAAELRQRFMVPLTCAKAQEIVAAVMGSRQYQTEIQRFRLPRSGLTLGAMNVIYRAAARWSHRCYFARYDSLPEPISCCAWLAQAFRLFSEPLVFVDRDGEETRLADDDFLLTPKTVIWDDNRLTTYVFRRLVKYPDITHMRRTIEAIQRRRGEMLIEVSLADEPLIPDFRLDQASETREAQEILVTDNAGEKGGDPMSGTRTVKKKKSGEGNGRPATKIRMIFVRDGQFTDEAKEQIRTWAKAGLKTVEIMRLLPDSAKPLKASVTAFVATANR